MAKPPPTPVLLAAAHCRDMKRPSGTPASIAIGGRIAQTQRIVMAGTVEQEWEADDDRNTHTPLPPNLFIIDIECDAHAHAEHQMDHAALGMRAPQRGA